MKFLPYLIHLEHGRRERVSSSSRVYAKVKEHLVIDISYGLLGEAYLVCALAQLGSSLVSSPVDPVDELPLWTNSHHSACTSQSTVEVVASSLEEVGYVGGSQATRNIWDR